MFAYIRGKKVAHISAVGDEYFSDGFSVPCDESVKIGDLWDGETFSTPAVPPVLPPTVGAIAFMRLFTSEERVKARELRVNDLRLDDFWKQLEDPRTDVVVMALPSVQEDIEYTLLAIKEGGLDLNVDERKTTILSGQIR